MSNAAVLLEFGSPISTLYSFQGGRTQTYFKPLIETVYQTMEVAVHNQIEMIPF